MKKRIQVKHRKLGRERVDGLAWLDDNVIEIDERLRNKRQMETYIHEALHILNPEWEEKKVELQSKKITEILWKVKYRKLQA